MCETRFVQRHDALLRFAAGFQLVVDALQAMAIDKERFDAKTRSRALSLLESVSCSICFWSHWLQQKSHGFDGFVVKDAAVSQLGFS